MAVLVENCGRVNYGKALDNQRKGIYGSLSFTAYYAYYLPIIIYSKPCFSHFRIIFTGRFPVLQVKSCFSGILHKT